MGQSEWHLANIWGAVARTVPDSEAIILLADYKAPRHYVNTEQVPRADNGKANYKAVKAIAQQVLGLD